MTTPQAFKDYSDVTASMSVGQKIDLTMFLDQWTAPKSRALYNAVAAACNVPAALVAAIHWRESNGDFKTYLEQGDPLGTWTWRNGDSTEGKPCAANAPGSIFFGVSDWVGAASLAFKDEEQNLNECRIDIGCLDINNLVEFTIRYNGEGYNHLGVVDPYAFAGTSLYVKGKYGSDGHYDPNLVDRQLGTLLLLRMALLGNYGASSA